MGRERYSAVCLMQKFVDLDYLGTKLQIISACALDHVKGFIIVEAEKQNDIYEVLFLILFEYLLFRRLSMWLL